MKFEKFFIPIFFFNSLVEHLGFVLKLFLENDDTITH